MPVPRAARLASRKSVVPDPSLYGEPSDDSDEDVPSARSNTTTTTTTTITNKPTSSSNVSNKKPRPSTSSKSREAHNHNSKSLAGSTESLAREGARRGQPAGGDQPEDPPTRPRYDAPLGEAHRHPSQPTKRKRVERAADDEGSEQFRHEDSTSRTIAPMMAPAEQGTSKRTRVNQEMSVDGLERGESNNTSQTSSQRKGHFVPRAAASQTTRPNKPPPQFSAVLDGSDDDSAPFLFTTNPPTPHAAVGSTGKRPAMKPKQNPKGKAPRVNTSRDVEDDAHGGLRESPVASTSRLEVTPPRTNYSTHEAITTHETPVQVRNIAFRQGLGTPGTTAKSARRNSNGSARRGSSIGGGFTATPHPEIKNEELWRSADPLLPIAARTRTIISWATQRDRTRLFEGKRLNENELLAKEVIDGFIDSICDLSIDTSVPLRHVHKPDPAELPPHPQNVANSAKKLELQEEFGAIAEEQTSRQVTSAIYSDFSGRRTTARETLKTSGLTRSLDALSIAETFDLSRPGPKTLIEALELGQKLLADAEAQTSSGGPTAKSQRMSKELGNTGETVFDSQIRETLEDTAHLQQLTHRLSGFTRVVSRFIDHRSAETHQSLVAQTLHGLEPTTATTSGTGDDQSTTATTGGTGLSRIAGTIGTSASVGGGIDPLDLLRAISRADSARH